MNINEKTVSYTSLNSYTTLNLLSKQTKNNWFICHGLGYLSRYFIKHFEYLDAQHNYIIAPQAPSKYYQGTDFKHVGASWLTKENTFLEVENITQYFNSIIKFEFGSITPQNLIVFGFSQGVSVALRWIAMHKIYCKAIIIYAGGIPNELKNEDFEFLNSDCQVFLVYGLNDQYLNETRLFEEKQKAHLLFKDRLTEIPFEGSHEINPDIIMKLNLSFK